jgi:hypothetical protein
MGKILILFFFGNLGAWAESQAPQSLYVTRCYINLLYESSKHINYQSQLYSFKQIS